MVKTGDGKHADEIKQRGHADGGPTPADPENPQAHQVQK